MRFFHLDTGRHWRGGQQQCALLCGGLAAAGHEVHLGCARTGELHARLARDAQGLRALYGLGSPGEMQPFAALRVARLLRNVNPDLIAAHDAHALALLAFGRWLSGCAAPLVYHRRVDVEMRQHAAARWKLRAPDLFICVSQAAADVLAHSGVGAKRIRVVHSGTEGRARVMDAKRSLCAELRVAPDARLIGIIAGLVPHKGHAILLDAFAQIAPRLADTQLIVVGSGPEAHSLRRRAERLTITPRTHFLGERTDIDRLLSALDLFVVASVTEGLNTSILDAFSLALPVVATRAGGIPELVVAGTTGWLAEPGNSDSLASAIEEALANPARSVRMAEEARRRFATRFTARVMTERTLDCYRELLAARGR